MELTSKTFRDVQFREKMRGGYHPEDVDEFLEQAAAAAAELQQRLRGAEERAMRAERALGEGHRARVGRETHWLHARCQILPPRHVSIETQTTVAGATLYW
jgi:DivIVA domain-containing protein